MRKSYLFLVPSLIVLLFNACNDSGDPNPDSTENEVVTIRSQQPVQVQFGETQDTLYFQFEVEQSGIIELSMEGEVSGIRLSLKEVSQEDRVLSNELLQPNQLIAYGPVKAGTYRLTLDDLLSSNSATSFTLRYLLNVSDPYEYNNSINDATPIDTTQTYLAYLYAENDIDYYKLEADRPEVATIEIAKVLGNVSNMLLEVFSDTDRDVPVYSASAPASEELQLRAELVNPGTYYIKVSADHSNGDMGERDEHYELKLSTLPYVVVDTTIDLSSQEFIPLQVDRGYVEIAGGRRGIIIYRAGSEDYRAFEKESPHRTGEDCALVEVDESGLFMREGCDNSIYDFKGNPSGGLAQFPLRMYNTELDEKLLRIYN